MKCLVSDKTAPPPDKVRVGDKLVDKPVFKADPEDPVLAKQARVAELAGLRAEIVGHQTARYSLDHIGLAGLAGLYAWLLADPGDERTGVSLIAFSLSVLVYMRQRAITLSVQSLAAYIRELELHLAAGGWEDWAERSRFPKRNTLLSIRVWQLAILATGLSQPSNTTWPGNLPPRQHCSLSVPACRP